MFGFREVNVRSLRFWPLQLEGWGFYFFINLISSIPYRDRPDYLAFRGTFLFTSFLASFPLHWLCHQLWERRARTGTMLIVCMLFSYPLGFGCAAAAFYSALWLSIHRPPFTWIDIFTATPGCWFTLMAWASFYFGIKYYLELEAKHRQLIASEMMAQEAQLQALRYQLQPHFLFNTLNAISTLALTGDTRRTTEMISNLAKLLRSTLDAPNLHEVTLSEELAVTEEYLAIEAARFGDRLSVRWSIDQDLEDVLVPRLILQPIIENAIRHGIARRARGGFILIQSNRVDETLCLTIENEPPEESEMVLFDGVPRSGNVGVENVRKRLSKLYGELGTMHTTTNTRGNYEVVLKLPICYAREELKAFALQSR